MSHPLARRLILGIAFSALGTGLTMPFLYVYLSQARGIPTQTVGFIFAWMGIVSFIAAPFGGTLIDRFGPRPIMLAGLVVEAITTYLIGHVSTVGQAVVVATLVCLGTVGLYPATTAMLTRLVPEDERQRAYGIQFMLMNAGFGIGGIVSSVIIDVTSIASFQLLYLIDALSYVGYIIVVLTLPRSAGSLASVADATGADEAPADGGWREVLADRTMLRFVLVSIVVVTFGYAQMEAGFTAYATQTGGVPANRLGWAYAANTGVIVLGQLVALRFIGGRSRSRLLAAAAALWSFSWVVIALSGRVDQTAAVVCAIVGLGLFGVGETLWAPVAPAVVNDLAPEHLRGRYNSFQSMVWTVAGVIGPASAGLLLGNQQAGWWVVAVVGGTALAALMFLELHRHLTPDQDGRADIASGVAAH